MTTGTQSDRDTLIAILQDAYSGELAAALAYRGHWKSVKNPEQRRTIQRIEQEEWDHRKRVGRMMEALGVKPVRGRELKRWIIGRVIAIGCHMVGWFIPMYFAGRLESQNICAYDVAAVHAKSLGLDDFERDLLDMEQVEQTHEEFFLGLVVNHRMFPSMRKLFGWGSLTEEGACVVEEMADVE
jgi:demethoxyubiquinone hydroxylase (CLK1/Coq7/Cat5 family)